MSIAFTFPLLRILRSALLFCMLLTAGVNTVQAQCDVDIHIANDQSGSIDATENAQARTFIKQLTQSLSLGNSNSQNRIALSQWWQPMA